MKRFNKEYSVSLEQRGQLIKESFKKEFNKIRRIYEGELNEGDERDWTEEVTLENGVTYPVYLRAYKLWTSDSIDRYSIYVKNNNLTKNDMQTLFALVANKHPTLIIGKVNHHAGMQTKLIIWSSDEKIHHQL